jgi:DNA repair protein RadC
MHLNSMGFLDKEEFRVITLNTRNMVMGVETIAVGSVNSVDLRTAEILRPAIVGNYPNIVLVHNHPSGNTSPSTDDTLLTTHIIKACQLFNIDCLDHVIVGRDDYTSLRESGVRFDGRIRF